MFLFPADFPYTAVTSFLGTLATIAIVIVNNRAQTRKTLAGQQKVADEQRVRHEEWKDKTDRRLNDHDEQHTSHRKRFDNLQNEFVPRTESTALLAQIRDSVASTDDWVRFLVKQKAVSPEDKG